MKHEGRCLLQAGKSSCWRCDLIKKNPAYQKAWDARARKQLSHLPQELREFAERFAERSCQFLGAVVGAVRETELYACRKFGTCTRVPTLPGMRNCGNCQQASYPEEENDPLQVVVTANGIGDHILGLTCCVGLKNKYPDRPVIFCCKPWCLPWIRLFDGYDYATSVQLNGVRTFYPYETYAAQNNERLARGQRVDYYAESCDQVKPVLPSVRPLSAHITSWAEQYRNHVVLVPFSTSKNRTWLLSHWLMLETLLNDLRIPTVVVDGGEPGKTATEPTTRRADVFRQAKLVNQRPAEIAALMQVSTCVIANDSGMAHLGGVLGVPTIALNGPILGEKVFGIYPSVRSLNGPMVCSGCHWHGPHWRAPCDTLCASLQAIEPQTVVEAVLTLYRQKAQQHTIVSQDRLDAIQQAIRQTLGVSGAMAELGVYRGGSSLFMSLADPSRPIYLFDTFAGLPQSDSIAGIHHAGEFACPVEEVKKLLTGRPAEFIQGVFPASTQGLEELEFSVVHVDGDLYETTRDAIHYFWPRIQSGGYLIFDDWLWPHTPGVAKAIREVFPAGMIEQSAAYQCRIRK